MPLFPSFFSKVGHESNCIHLVFIMLIHQVNGFRFKAWGKPDPHRPAEDLAFAVARFYQSKGTLQNYYMVCLPQIYAFKRQICCIYVSPNVPDTLLFFTSIMEEPTSVAHQGVHISQPAMIMMLHLMNMVSESC